MSQSSGMETSLFYPVSTHLPQLVSPRRESRATFDRLMSIEWSSFGQGSMLIKTGALWLHGFLSECHELAQAIPTVEGSYWHALMHRSEPDFGNSKYWYRQVGNHAIFSDLKRGLEKFEIVNDESRKAIEKLSCQPGWDPFGFVDLVERAASRQFSDSGLLQRIAQLEYNLLMKFCLDHCH